LLAPKELLSFSETLDSVKKLF